MIPPPFRYLAPTSLGAALALLAEHEGATVLAGGQSLINALKLDLVAPPTLVDVHRLPELRTVEEQDGTVRIGAAVTYSELARHPLVREKVPVLADVAGALVDRQVRNRGTIGGNCCLNDPTNNFPPLLAALDASFEVRQHGGEPENIAADDFFLGTLLTVAHGPALLTAVNLPAHPARADVAYRHHLIGADSWALARAVLRVDVDGDDVIGARAYLGAVADSPRRLPAVEAALTDSALCSATVQAALAAFDTEPLEMHADSHASAAYRLALARVQLKRAVNDVVVGHFRTEEAAA